MRAESQQPIDFVGKGIIIEPIQMSVEVLHVTYHNQENGWSVLKIRDLQSLERETAVGVFSTIHAGESYRLSGLWATHPSFGKQFKIQRATEILPHTESGLIRYLSSGVYKGIGPKIAERIVSHFGTQTLDILHHHPQKLMDVPKMTARLAKKVAQAWKEKQLSADTLIFLSEHGMSSNLSQKIAKTYGDKTIEIISRNPYQLIDDFRGIGFFTADKIARALGCASDSLFRLQAGILHLLRQGEERGHCYLTAAQLQVDLQTLLQLTSEQITARTYPALEELQKKRAVVESEGNYYRQELYLSELSSAIHIARILQTPVPSHMGTPEAIEQEAKRWVEAYQQKNAVQVSQRQSDAILQAAQEKVFILTGGPGVGKTTTVRALILFFQSQQCQVLLAAPTGRAAQRLSEISPIPAKTIHRMLEWSASENHFIKDASNPLRADVVVIDEASMLDIHLASQLLQAIPSTSRLILIGDVDQLPAVGPGNFLSDLLQSKCVPCLQLTEIFRQAASSQIVQIAHAINKGQVPTFEDQAGTDCLFLPAHAPQDIMEMIRLLMGKTLRERGFDPTRDVQILTPMNRGPLGSLALNQEMQALLNPKPTDAREGDVPRNGFVLRTGDKVIQTVNNYEQNVFNGDIGFVEYTKVEGGKVVVSFQGRTIQYEGEGIQELLLAYAVSIHKSQGSEFPVVVIPVSMQHYIMLQRNLFYTALTRGKKLVIFIGEPKALAYAIHNQDSRKRQTQLSMRVQGALS